MSDRGADVTEHAGAAVHQPAETCWRSECRVTCYYPDACSELGRVLKAAAVPVHYVVRYLKGDDSWVLPLCWEADLRRRIDPTAIVATENREAVTCRECLEWLYA